MTYLKKICEEIIRRHAAGHPSQDNTLKYGEVKVMVCQVINEMFKKEIPGYHQALGDQVPPHHSLMEYEVSVAASDELIVTVDCEVWPGALAGNFWSLPNQTDFWNSAEPGEPDDYWMIDTTASTITVTDSGSGVYSVVFGSIVLKSGYDYDDLVAWIGECASTSYLRLRGPADTLPSIFAMSGISGLTATADGFSFSYDTNNIDGFVGDVLTSIIESSARLVALAGAGETDIDVVAFSCCTPSTNVDYRKGEITLPAMPLNLEMGRGIFRIYDPANRFSSFIPLTAGGFDLVNGVSHTGLSTVISGLNCYEWYSYDKVIFNKSISELPDSVRVQLVVTDVTKLGDTDLLPIPADYEWTVINAVLERVGVNTSEDLATDQNEMR